MKMKSHSNEDEFVKCKNCDNDAVIEDPKDQFYCDGCYKLFKILRKDYWGHPDATGLEDKK